MAAGCSSRDTEWDGLSEPRIARRVTFFILLGLSAVFGAMCGLMVVYSIDLPQMEDLARYRPNTTTELLDVHGKVFGSFALERRVVVPYSEFPLVLRQAILSIEDKSFERNWGVNLVRAVGAAYRDLHARDGLRGHRRSRCSWRGIFFFRRRRRMGGRFRKSFCRCRLSAGLRRSRSLRCMRTRFTWGVGRMGLKRGSQYYFNKHVRDLTLPEAALLAALPKGPEYYSPVRFPDRALKRRNLVLSEMLSDGKITQQQADAAMAAPLGLHIEAPPNSVAPYFVEEVRRQLEKEYGVEEVHGAGLRVYTTLDLNLQLVANKAVLDGTATYERRHGWKGGLANVVLGGMDVESYKHPDWTQPMEKGTYVHGVVTRFRRNGWR